jgi:hypothetical protein
MYNWSCFITGKTKLAHTRKEDAKHTHYPNGSCSKHQIGLKRTQILSYAIFEEVDHFLGEFAALVRGLLI